VAVSPAALRACAGTVQHLLLPRQDCPAETATEPCTLSPAEQMLLYQLKITLEM